MKKTLIITLALSILTVAGAQVKKCGIDTRALVAEEIAAGNTTVNMLAKMVPGYDRSVFEKAGIVIGAEAGQIVTMRVPVSKLGLLESSKDVIQYSISHHIAAPTCNNNRVDTRTDSVQNGWGVEGDTSFDGAGVYIGITDWGFPLRKVGLGYLHLNQSLSTLSGGELQRIKLASYLNNKGKIFILDEPSDGLHLNDIDRILKLFDGMVEQGNTIFLIEHNLEMIKACDYVIELGPGGGNKGGRVLFEGTPRAMAQCEASVTGSFLLKENPTGYVKHSP